MSADNLPRINILRLEAKYAIISPASKNAPSLVQEWSLGNPKISGSICPYAVNFSKIGLNKKTLRVYIYIYIYIPHFLRRRSWIECKIKLKLENF